MIHTKNCTSGERYTTDGRCETCETGFYNLVPQTEPGNCLACPFSKAICEKVDGKNSIRVRPGFWRSSANSDDFYECLYPPACTG